MAIQRISNLLFRKPPSPNTDGLLQGSGAVTPTNGTKGYAKGAIFQNTTDGLIYRNGGTVASSAFVALADVD